MDAADELMKLYPMVFFACHTRHLRDPKTKQSLTSNQVGILQHLDGHRALPVLALARHMGVTPATMSLSINRLERLGYLKREKSETDRRVVNLLLTEDGERIKRAEQVLDRDLVAHLLSRLSQQERDEALHGLRLLAGAAEDAGKLKEQRSQEWLRQQEEKWQR
jgi:MarR family transcriptional regulator, organic hydroperoxide resistance regulator